MINTDLLLTLGANYKKVAAGEIIFLEGNRCNYYYELVSGRVRWANFNDEGKEYLQMLVEPGECFGELPLFDGLPYAATAIADEDSLVIRLHQATFHELLKDNPDIHYSFSRLLAERLRFKFFILTDLLHKEPEDRIKSLINYLQLHKHHVCSDCGKINLTRQQIANMTCLRVETVIRAMRTMHDRGEIAIKKGKVFLSTPNPVLHCHN